MECFVRNLIEYEGIDFKTSKYNNMSSFKQTTIDLNLELPLNKPEIDHLIKIFIKKEIIKYKVVKTPIGTSVEGQIITGNKLLVMGELALKINYVTSENIQSIHSFEVIVPFCEHIVLPINFKSINMVNPEIYIEDIYIKQKSNKSLFGNVTLLSVANLY